MLTRDQRSASQILLTGQNVFVTGGGGVGKTTLIHRFETESRKRGKKVLLLAPTGLAAYLIGGSTIHSAFRIPFDLNKADISGVVEIMKAYDIIIIDEISMVSAKMFSFLAKCLAKVPKRIQIVVVGDFYQLPPVKAEYAFATREWWEMHFVTCNLEEVVRQADEEFVHHLNQARVGNYNCPDYFNQNCKKTPIENAIYLCVHNNDAKAINAKYLRKLPGISKIYKGECTKKVSPSELRVDEELEFKVGMRVMSVINAPNHRYQNGSQGTIVEMADEYVKVRFDMGNVETLCRHGFTVCANDGDETVFRQIPLLPAYAISIHKSQGQTFEAVNIIGDCWAEGQLYVALSRAKTMDGIYLQKPIEKRHLKCSKKVNDFYKRVCNIHDVRPEVKYQLRLA